MDKNEYKRRLEEFAVVKEKKPAKSPTHNRLAKEVVIEVDPETGEEIEVEREITENPTLGFEVKIKDRIALCELGCGEVVTNQIIEKRLHDYPEKHWRTRCKNCDCYESPDGVGFIKGGTSAHSAWIRYLKHPEAFKDNPNPKFEPVKGQVLIEEVATKEGVIRRYE